MARREPREVVVTLPASCRGLAIGLALSLTLLLLFRPSQPPPPPPSPPLHAAYRSVPLPHLAQQRREVTAADPPPPSPPPPPPTTRPEVETPPPPGSAATVAMCVGGLLSLTLHEHGLSVRRGVLAPLVPDVFVAGTLDTAKAAGPPRPAWERRVAGALRSISALAPFAAVEVLPQPTVQELSAALKRSGHWAQFETQVSANGAGKLRPEDSDPRLWLPTILSPALGNPSANTLREFHYQSRCMNLIEAREASHGAGRAASLYDRVLFTRLEMEWLYPHPPLALLPAGRVWIPAGEDNAGLNDRHWISDRAAASLLMRRWDSLLDGSALVALHGSSDAARVRPKFVSSEIFMLEYARHHKLGFGRFPNTAYLACCEDSYRDAQGNPIGSVHSGAMTDTTVASSQQANLAAGGRQCYQPHCNVKRCPSSAPLKSVDVPRGSCGFKYDDEGSAAVVNAELLARPGAGLALAAGPPARLEISVPVGDGGRQERLYFCFRCNEDGRHGLNSMSNRTAGCLFGGHRYDVPQLRHAVRRNHHCKHYPPALMRELCASLSRPGDRPDHRGATYGEQYFPWWCRNLDEVGEGRARRQQGASDG